MTEDEARERMRKMAEAYDDWAIEHPGAEPDDDPAFVEMARRIADLPPLAAELSD